MTTSRIVVLYLYSGPISLISDRAGRVEWRFRARKESLRFFHGGWTLYEGVQCKARVFGTDAK